MYGPQTSQNAQALPPPPPPVVPAQPQHALRPVDNRPAWMTQVPQGESAKRVDFDDKTTILEDEPSQKSGRLCVMTADLFISNLAQESVPRKMPLDLDNGLPGILVRLGHAPGSDICFLCHVDSCAAMNTGNLLLHQYIITQHPTIVAEYIQYDDKNPFDPIKLQCAVDDNGLSAPENGKLTAIVRYHTPYKFTDGSPVLVSFGLGKDVAVRSILGLPTLRQWQSSIDFASNKLVCPKLQRRFDLHYERARQGLPDGIHFNKSDFQRPRDTLSAVLHTTFECPAITDGCDDVPNHTKSATVTDDNSNGYLVRSVKNSHLN